MIPLLVKLNGKRICTAGAEDLSVLSAIVTAVGRLGAKTVPARPREKIEIHYSVRGLTGRRDQEADEHLLWQPLAHLNVGDLITIKVLETERADLPRSSTPVDRHGRKSYSLKQRQLHARAATAKPSARRA